MKLAFGKKAAKKVMATLAAAATLSATAIVGAGTAQANPREWLRPDATGTCEWDAVQYWVQRCDVFSPASGRNIPVQIQPAARGGNAGLYFLAGAAAGQDNNNNWMTPHFGGAPAKFLDDNITLVAPVGGAGTFYTNIFDPTGAPADAWETFITYELPSYLERNFGVSRSNNAVVGMSMGATAAMSLAARYPQQFKQVLSYSGYLTLGGSVGNAAAALALNHFNNLSLPAVYGTFLQSDRPQHDPYLNIDALKGRDVYVSAASGIPGSADLGLAPGAQVSGAAMEVASIATTQAWDAAARAKGLQFTANYQPFGLHNWANWSYQLTLTHDRIVDALNAR